MRRLFFNMVFKSVGFKHVTAIQAEIFSTISTNSVDTVTKPIKHFVENPKRKK